MRLSTPLLKQHSLHIKRMKWLAMCRRRVQDDGTKAALEKSGITVYDALEVAKLPRFPPLGEQPVGDTISLDWELPLGPGHPDWQERTAKVYNQQSTLLEGLPQAQRLTRSIILGDLPQRLQQVIGKKEIVDQDLLVQRCVRQSGMMDATQVKLPHLPDPLVYGINKRREYGIPIDRKCMILTRGLLKLCSHALGDYPGLLKRITLHSAPLNLPLEQEGQLLICDISADSLLLSPWPLQPFIDVEEVEALSSAAQLPNLQPVHHTVSLRESNTYRPEFFFPVNRSAKQQYPHVIFLHNDYPYNENWTPELRLARPLMHCFAWALAFARHHSVKEKGGVLEEPLSLQCIHHNSQEFTFSCFQLNTLNIDGTEGIKNFYWTTPAMNIHDFCSYHDGRPVLKNYNPQVMQYFLAFFLDGNPPLQEPIKNKVNIEH
ncbi:unnamed protein product [Darwinula stevensoni]|uniref:Large ribosomal subunit protein mL37 n=1 Tax=Darwinula stevensoni TaxID=69355 RepID=A0A7R8X4Z8_9CRUS|nr:unnamed protein product [Darwinula stevensoni]CAG0886596.1 unnamed protein product [Darwinula stevensoni]